MCIASLCMVSIDVRTRWCLACDLTALHEASSPQSTTRGANRSGGAAVRGSARPRDSSGFICAASRESRRPCALLPSMSTGPVGSSMTAAGMPARLVNRPTAAPPLLRPAPSSAVSQAPESSVRASNGCPQTGVAIKAAAMASVRISVAAKRILLSSQPDHGPPRSCARGRADDGAGQGDEQEH